jgi:hypothetical protein
LRKEDGLPRSVVGLSGRRHPAAVTINDAGTFLNPKAAPPVSTKIVGQISTDIRRDQPRVNHASD